MNKIQVATAQAPAAIGPYSQAIKCGNILFISGQIPLNPADGSIPEGIEASDRSEHRQHQSYPQRGRMHHRQRCEDHCVPRRYEPLWPHERGLRP
mgnify:CR=1 FL=1